MSEQAAARSHLTGTAYDLRGVLKASSKSCPICAFSRKALEQEIAWIYYERVNDEQTREAIRGSRGFCRDHSELVAQRSEALGTAILLADVLANELRDLERGSFDKPPASRSVFSRLLNNGVSPREKLATCPFCKTEGDLDNRGLDALLQGLKSSNDFRQAFSSSSGLCLPHFRRAFETWQDRDVWEQVLEKQKVALEDLAAELSDLARKFDYRFSHERRGAESDSWKRALKMTSGNRRD